jgi:stage II sporulation protein AA (anti-sigma F factor antagonist)
MVNIIKINDTILVKLKGDLDHHSAEEIRKETDEQIKKHNPKKLIFDFSSVTFMDSSGIGVVMGRYKQIKESGGDIALIGINNRIDKLIAVSGLLKIIPVFNTLDEAM